jgi:hypothetical protein
MKSLRLLALTLLACTCSAAQAHACDNTKSAASTTPSKSTTASVASSSKTPAVPASGGCCAEAMTYKTAATSTAASAQCTPAMHAACEKNPAVAAAMGCSTKGTTASTASTAKGASCAMHGSATAAGMDHCSGAKGASLTMAAAGMICSEHMSGVTHDCSACAAWADCDQAVHALGGRTQVVSLKNGAMIVYTAESNADVKALQSLISKRNDKMVSALSASSDKKLCDECKALRGAMASGKLHREVVNVERGCLTLITSDDRALVQKIRAMTGQPVAMR